MTREEGCLFWLAQVKGLGYKRMEKLMERFGSAEGVFEASRTEWEAVVGAAAADSMEKLRNPAQLNESYRQIRALHCEVLTRAHPLYPKALLQTPDAPFVLYAKGNLFLLETECMAVVGSRQCTNYGAKAAAHFGAGLARAGITVVSGLARGVDSIAQEAALNVGGGVIAVLGTGLDGCYPPEHQALQERIGRDGLLISESGFGRSVQSWQFSARNRIIAGVSRGVLVVEADERSGSLITAGYAVDYDRELFAVPGSIFSDNSRGCNQLLRYCARPALGIEDVTSALLTDTREPLTETQEPLAEKKRRTLPEDLTMEEKKVCERLKNEDLSFDELVDGCGFEAGKLNSLLTMLEMREIIVKTPGRIYSLNV